MTDLVERLTRIADASRREDGSDIPLGEQCREAAVTISALRAEVERITGEARHKADLISAAIGTVRFMDPPDGGDVSIDEQVRRMRVALDTAEARIKELEALNASFSEKKRYSLSFDGKTYCDDDNPDLWTIHEERGPINDREWTVLGRGVTAFDAMRAALHPRTEGEG